MIILLALGAGFLLFAVVEILWVAYNGNPVARPDIPRGEQTVGSGPALRYAVLGDSTSVSQGGDYEQGYAVQSARFLAKTHTVTWINVGVSGARAADVDGRQLSEVLAFKPDIALIAVGANDVTHLTAVSKVKKSLSHSIAELRRVNPQVHIVLTGSPDMGTVPRFPQPLRWYAGKRTINLNRMIAALAKEKNVSFAPIAERTGPTFRKHPELFAIDKFHPTTEGYKLWVPVIIEALSKLAVVERANGT